MYVSYKNLEIDIRAVGLSALRVAVLFVLFTKASSPTISP